MLIENKTLAQNDVATLRLITGEEVIGKVVSVNDKEIVITRPVVIQMQMLSQSQAGLGFVPFVVSIDEGDKFLFTFDKLICAPLKTRKDVATNYLQATSKIAIPANGGIIA